MAIEKEFEFLHTLESSRVFFSGYKFFQPADGDQMDFDSEELSKDEEEEKIVPVTRKMVCCVLPQF